jgi:uroporphyrinogen-III synthase
VRLGGTAAARVLRGAVVACIGPTTAAAARELGLTVHVEAVPHTGAALAAALAAHFTPVAGAAR